MAHLDPGHISDGVVRSGRPFEGNAEIPAPRLRLGMKDGKHGKNGGGRDKQ
jgi:hypothetical protein